jgi:coenzyme PQQ precursor peptide PqqA
MRCNFNLDIAEIVLSCSTFDSQSFSWEHGMAWTTPELVEICIGMEINAYAPAEF